MKINTKLMLLTAIGLIVTAMVISGLAIERLKHTEKIAVTHFEQLGAENVKEINADGVRQLQAYREELLARKKEYLKSQVQTTMSVLEKGYRDAHDPDKLQSVYKEQLQNAVNTAYSMIEAISQQSDLTLAEQQAQAIQLVKVLRYGSENKDYFWINDMQPVMVMHPYKPELDGEDLSQSKDPNGKFLFNEMVKVCREQGEGFVDYYWPKYGADKPQPKLSFVKRLEAWDWIIGSGVYMEIAEGRLKADASAIVKSLRYGAEKQDYFWINDMQPVMVMHPYKPELDGQDLSQSKDPNGKFLFNEMVKVCREQGEGFVDYYWPKYGADKPQPKLSFVMLFKEWNWVIGTGIYIDDVDAAVEAQKRTLDRRVQSSVEETQREVEEIKTEFSEKMKHMVWLIGLVCLLILVTVLVVSSYYIKRSISRPIKHVISGLNEGSEQLAAGSDQVAVSSQSLAEGSSEQASTIEETASSLEEMAAMTQQNAENAKHADSLMQKANEVVGKANGSMNELITSINEIAKAGEETSKIIKTIDEIAFQTNLLALNAAVEAARAGEAGAGFAVVADEVRNLAIRAADAAKTTAQLIQGTVKKTKDGSELVTRTNDAFAQVAASATKVAELVGEIAAASSEQAQGISQINTAVTEMDKVVQENAANAEESASAAEEISAQTFQLKSMVSDLVSMVEGRRNRKETDPEIKAKSGKTSKPKTGALSGRSFMRKQPRKTEIRQDDTGTTDPSGEESFRDF